MHELALARSILETALDRAEGRRVTCVEVSVGALRQVVPASLAFNFEILARDTLCEGAVLEQRLQPARLRCACDAEWELEELLFSCPRCGSSETEVTGGEELLIEAIEVEEVPCTVRR